MKYKKSIYKPIYETVEQFEETFYRDKMKKILNDHVSQSVSQLIPHALPRPASELRMLTNSSSLGLTSLAGKRRINEDGLRML